ncbi:MAG: valine--tRNA ligase [Nitrospirae bacterium]|nr:valine--tRNA ligase [Nitrospirota bacterium]
MIEKSYSPKDIEEKWYRLWLEKGYFQAESKSSKPSYCIVIPPPNVTGSLHIGHALDATLQDILIRWKRMSGFNALWLPGTDHAGIATQNVVEKDLKKEGLDRHKLGRDEFIRRVWKWKGEYGGRIISQLKRLGASCDWSRERFTLDEGLSKAVREVFVRLYEEGLIYRGDYIINWCPRCHTALSDLEVEHEEIKGKLYHIKYPFANEKGYLTVATTRPETMLGDVAVAVNPDDERYKGIVGKVLRLPLLNREIPVIADEFVDPEFGTGAVKVTPAHDPNDFEMARRHNLPFIKIMTGDAKMSDDAGPYKGQDRFKCRENVLSDLQSLELLGDAKEHTINLGHCYRCKTVVEPYLSKQWFVKTKPLAQEAIKAVKDKRINIIPEGWENSYFDWMENIKDWCISRQIWWGHRIPVWYCQDMQSEECKNHGGIIVSIETPEKCPSCGSNKITQDEDVLDTWFSSALWPFSTLGWPAETDDLKTFYPTSVLVTGFDIIFFWVARMIMMGLKFMGDAPFRDVYIHALIRDSHGQKMSKSKGNVVDPLEIIDTYGADAFRFTLTAFAAQGRDIKFSVDRVEGYRHFINKIWNATRFILMNIKDAEEVKSVKEISCLSLADRWILNRLAGVIEEVNKALDEYRFNDAASVLYQFVWHEFCDWYLEMVKPTLARDDDNKGRSAAISTLLHILEISLRLLHPFMPFITEKLWHDIPSQRDKEADSICVQRYPKPEDSPTDRDAERKMNIIMDAIIGIRSIRGELNLPPSLELKALINTSDGTKDILNENVIYISKLAKVKDIEIGEDITKPQDAATSVRPSMQIFVPLTGLLDMDAEIKRLEKEILKIEETASQLRKKLSNREFVSKAPKEVVEENKAKYDDFIEKIHKIQENIEKLKQLRRKDG